MLQKRQTNHRAPKSSWHCSVALYTAIVLPTGCRSLFMHRISRHEFAGAPDMFDDVPVVVENVITQDDCHQWWTHISSRSKNELVQWTCQKPQQQTNQQLLEDQFLKLKDAQTLLLLDPSASSHANPMVAVSLGSSCSTDQLPLSDFIEELFVNEFTESDDTLDWFSCLSRHAPVHDTLVLSGTGSSSSPKIQSHPFTKLSLCLQGSQIWRLVPPTANHVFQTTATSITKNAWEGFQFSIGYQGRSDWDLFHFKHRDVDTEMENSKEESDDDDDDDKDDKDYFYDSTYDDFQQWAEDPSMLVPNFQLPFVTEYEDDGPVLWHSTVTLPGDLLVIPPGWWYQSYNLESSVSVLSQRCIGSLQGTKFHNHILENAAKPSLQQRFIETLGDNNKEEENYYTDEEAQHMMDKLFELLEKHYRQQQQ